MSRSRPASNPISYHKHTKQHYVTRGGKRLYLGSDKNQAIKRYHRLGLGLDPIEKEEAPPLGITVKEVSGTTAILKASRPECNEGTGSRRLKNCNFALNQHQILIFL